MADLQAIVQQLNQLTLLEAAELVKLILPGGLSIYLASCYNDPGSM